MGCGSSSTRSVLVPETDATTRNFDRLLEEEKAEANLHFKLLTLGAGESGKSTIIKQLIFLHKSHQTTDEERHSYVYTLHGNVLNVITTLINEATLFGYVFADEHLACVELIQRTDTQGLLSTEVVDAIETLWLHSDAIRATYERRGEFWMLERAEYYFDNMRRFVQPDFVPTEEDIVAARKRTTGVVETQIKYGGVNWSVVDVGGQRSERRKWLNCFDNVKGIMFAVNLAGYASVLFEDRAVNRMQESLKLFEETMANPLFAETPVFLMLNKKDLFEKLIETKPLTLAFPEYDGPQELRPCIEYIANQYAAKLKPSRAKPMVLLMAARLKKDVQYCFEDIKDTLLDLNRSGIKKATEKLTQLREQFKNEQLKEMEKNLEEARKQHAAAAAAAAQQGAASGSLHQATSSLGGHENASIIPSSNGPTVVPSQVDEPAPVTHAE